jgi:sulfatase maturation enzyme AslB (radical SAM superfamily)
VLGGIPRNFQIFLTQRCQIACTYCYLDKKAVDLKVETAMLGLQEFLKDSIPGDRWVSFYGGEPLLAFPLLKQIADWIRRKYPPEDVRMHLTTNGILVDHEVALFCATRKIGVTLSLDGPRQRHDSCRKIKKSSYDAVLKAADHLRDCGVRLQANMVIRPADAGHVLKNIKHIASKHFAQIDLLPDGYVDWTPLALNAFAGSMKQLRDYYIGQFAKGKAAPFTMGQLHYVMDEKRPYLWKNCSKRILSSDGKYYSCDRAMALPLEMRSTYACGDPYGGYNQAHSCASLEAIRSQVRIEGKDRCRSCPWASKCFCYLGHLLGAVDVSVRYHRWDNACRISKEILSNCGDIAGSLKTNAKFREMYSLV